MLRIFISYRRADTQAMTGRIYDRLVAEFGNNAIFKDVDRIPPGSTFSDVLEAELARCNVLLIVIGRSWVTIRDEDGQQRLENPEDFVRIEVERGLRHPNMLVIPVLVEGAQVPDPADLPDSLDKISTLQAVSVRHDPDFHRDMNRLIEFLAVLDQQGQVVRQQEKETARRRIKQIFAGFALLCLILVVSIFVAIDRGIIQIGASLPPLDIVDVANTRIAETRTAMIVAQATNTFEAAVATLMRQYATQTASVWTDTPALTLAFSPTDTLATQHAPPRTSEPTATPTSILNVQATQTARESFDAQVRRDAQASQTANAAEQAIIRETAQAVANATSYAATIGKSEGQISIIAWAGYIERGDTDENYDWVTDFEATTGCAVTVKIVATSEEMVALMNEGNFDLVTASGDVSLSLIAGGRIQPVNINLIPSWSTVDERLQNAPWHTVDGIHYGVPYQWGSNVLMYNTDIFPEAPTSWDVVFEEQTLPDGRSNAGRIQAYDSPIYIADAALYLMTHNPELGITDPYELDRGQFNAALNLLRQQRSLIARYWRDTFIQIDDFANEGIAASSAWPFQVNLLQAGGYPIGSTIPFEGATGWADTTMMHANTQHPNCAYMWLEHSLNPKHQGDLAAWYGSVPSVPAACEGNQLLGENGCAINGFNDFDKISFWKTPITDCGDNRGEVCVPFYEWGTNYLAVIGGR